jgi:hypothetical protein
MTDAMNTHDQDKGRYNIFRIIESSDKELMHSSMVKFFIENNWNNLSECFRLNDDVKDLNINLEESHSYKVEDLSKKRLSVKTKDNDDTSTPDFGFDQNKKNVRIRFDIVGRRKNDKTLAFVIENKFKAIPTINQLKIYDAAIERECPGQEKDKYPKKILMVFLRQQISRELNAYLEEHEWVAVPYLDDIESTDVSPGGEEHPSLSGILKKIDTSLYDTDRKYIIEKYRERLDEHQAAINKLWKSPYIVTYNGPKIPLTIVTDVQGLIKREPNDSPIESRFLFLQYLIALQHSIDAILRKKAPGISYDLSNNGSSQTVPSVAFWRNFTNSANANIPTIYFSIDGMTAKIGLNFPKNKGEYIEKELDDIRNFMVKKISERKHIGFYSSDVEKKKNSKPFQPADAERSNGSSVYALFCFSIKESTREEFTEQSARLIEHIFSEETIQDIDKHFNQPNKR